MVQGFGTGIPEPSRRAGAAWCPWMVQGFGTDPGALSPLRALPPLEGSPSPARPWDGARGVGGHSELQVRSGKCRGMLKTVPGDSHPRLPPAPLGGETGPWQCSRTVPGPPKERGSFLPGTVMPGSDPCRKHSRSLGSPSGASCRVPRPAGLRRCPQRCWGGQERQRCAGRGPCPSSRGSLPGGQANAAPVGRNLGNEAAGVICGSGRGWAGLSHPSSSRTSPAGVPQRCAGLKLP